MPKESPKSYSEAKERRVSASLTPTGYQGLNALAQAKGVSLSELLERIGRGVIALDREGPLLGELCAN
jgi:predicted transcriptional regulator